MPGQIKQGGGPDSAFGPCVSHLWLKGTILFLALLLNGCLIHSQSGPQCLSKRSCVHYIISIIDEDKIKPQTSEGSYLQDGPTLPLSLPDQMFTLPCPSPNTNTEQWVLTSQCCLSPLSEWEDWGIATCAITCTYAKPALLNIKLLILLHNKHNSSYDSCSETLPLTIKRASNCPLPQAIPCEKKCPTLLFHSWGKSLPSAE